MKTGAIATMVLRLSGVMALVLGVFLWNGGMRRLVPGHMLFGIIVVLALWLLAYFGWRGGASVGLVATAVIWGLIVAWLGMRQTTMMVGDSHWMIRVVHLLMGIGAIGLGESLGKQARSATST